MEYISAQSCFIPEKPADFEKHFEEECTTITWEISRCVKWKPWLQIPEVWIKELMLPVLRAYFKAGAYPHVPSGGAGRLSAQGQLASFKLSLQSPASSIQVVFRQWNLGLRILEAVSFENIVCRDSLPWGDFLRTFVSSLGETYGLIGSPSDQWGLQSHIYNVLVSLFGRRTFGRWTFGRSFCSHTPQHNFLPKLSALKSVVIQPRCVSLFDFIN